MSVKSSSIVYELSNLEDVYQEDSNDITEETWSSSSLKDRVKDSIDNLDYIISIDRTTSKLELFSRNGELIWTIWKWTFEKGLIVKKCHLFKRIEENFRWKWFWTALMQEYIDAWFELPDYEVTWVFESYILLMNFWYFFHSVINPKNAEELNLDTIPSNLQIKTLISKWYVIKLEKSE